MITKIVTVGSNMAQMRGKSTDEKPTDVGNGSSFYEMDTQELFMFDEETKAWIKQ